MREAISETAPGEEIVLVQDVICGGKHEEVGGPSRSLDLQERADIERMTTRLTHSYLDWVDTEQFDKAYAMLSEFLQSSSPFKCRKAEQVQFRSKYGAFRAIDIWRVTVYVDPPGAPEPSIYVATDFEGSYESLLVCGYYVWLEGADNTFRIIRQEVGYLEKTALAQLSDSELKAARSKLLCRDSSAS